ncbi:MAG: GatB/YqeY domain-containing protein [Deltaproteobacteria bacterium]|nr:GatB/YqeY domain-containing protein [Deltaproteobacteria bacterium]
MPVEAFERMQADIKEAMRSHAKDKLIALRTLHSEIKNVSVNAGKELTEDDFIAVVTRAIKQRTEAAEQYEAGNRADLAAKERAEIGWLQAYLPAALGRDEVAAIIQAAIAEVEAKGKQDMGKVMKVVMPKVKGRCDGKLVNQMVGELLAQQG